MGTNSNYSEKGLYRDGINNNHAVVELPIVDVDSTPTTTIYAGKYNDHDDTTLFPTTTNENLPTTRTSWPPLCRCFWSFLRPTISTGFLLCFIYVILPSGLDGLWGSPVWYTSLFTLNALHQILVAAVYLCTEYHCCCWLYYGCEEYDDVPNTTTNHPPSLRTVVGFTILLSTAGSNALLYLFLGVTCLDDTTTTETITFGTETLPFDEYLRRQIVNFSSLALLSTVYHAVILSRSSVLWGRRRRC